MQGGTHEETPRPAISLMDGAAKLLAETGVGLSVVEVEVVASEVVKLVFGEAQFPGNITPADGEGIVMFDDEGNGIVVK